MPIEILMPALSPTMTEGNLVNWCKKEGDKVKAGELLAEIETDKATMEVEAVDEGVLGKILVQAGTENVAVNTLIALLLEDGEDASALDNFQSSGATAPASTAEASSPAIGGAPMTAVCSSMSNNASSGERIIASPLARRIATQNDVMLSAIEGSGPNGRIVKKDVEQAISSGAGASQPTASSAPSQPVAAPVSAGGYEDIPLTNMRKVIARRLVESKQTVPHFYLTIDCEMDALLALRSQLNTNREEKISVNDFIIKACAQALVKVPEANVTWHDTFVRRYDYVDISIAVAIDGGLVTPVIRQSQVKAIGQISKDAKDLIAKARAGKLTPEAYQGGTFTVSNLGMFGIDQFCAIINPPQACILAVGQSVKKPVVKNDAITIATVMTCTLSIDHRSLDGAVGAKFLAVFKELIENPMAILV